MKENFRLIAALERGRRERQEVSDSLQPID